MNDCEAGARAVEEKYRRSLAEEGITTERLATVDLSSGYTPVIPVKGGTLADAVPAVPTRGGDYIVRAGSIAAQVPAADLKIMRLRYLLVLEKAAK
jgi:hypothetical protein